MADSADTDEQVHPGEKLREWLKSNDKTQAWLAQETDASQASVSEWVSGRRIPGLPAAVRIERLAGIPVAEWLEAMPRTA